MSLENFQKSKRYKEFMKDNWAQLTAGKYWSQLSPKEKKIAQKGIEGDMKHNEKDAAKLKGGK